MKCLQGEEFLIHTNGGSLTYHHIADVKFIPLQAYHNPNLLAYILSLKHVMIIPGYKVDMFSNPESAFLVSKVGNSIVCFSSGNEGLFHCKVGDLKLLKSTGSDSASHITSIQGEIFESNAENGHT